MNDASATALFDIIEYYEAANEIDISENRNITNRGWQACINMVKRSHALQILVTRGTPLSESNAVSLGKSMLSSSLNTLKLEHCGLSGRPMASLCKINDLSFLKKKKNLWLTIKKHGSNHLMYDVYVCVCYNTFRYLLEKKYCFKRAVASAQ